MKRTMQGLVAVVGVLLCTANGALAAKGRTAVHMTGVLNLNQASPAQLDLLPGWEKRRRRKSSTTG